MAINVRRPGAIDPAAKIAADVSIGPFCVIGPDVSIGQGTRLESHVTLMGRVTLGAGNHIFSGAVIGQSPHDIDHDSEGGRPQNGSIVVGDQNVIREGVTIVPGSSVDRATILGSQNMVMACCQVGSGCRLGDRISIANGTVLESGARVENHAALSGRVIVRPGIVVGSYSFTSIAALVVRDVPPFMIVEGMPARARTVNLVGLSRNGFSPDAIGALKSAYRWIFRDTVNLDEARVALLAALLEEPRLEEMLQFIETHSEDGQRNNRCWAPAANRVSQAPVPEVALP